MLENASLTSENIDQLLVPELMTLSRRTARSLKQLEVQHSSAAIAPLYNIQRPECVCTVCTRLCVFCHFIGATSESKTQIYAQK